MSKKVVFCESGYNRFYGAQQSLFNFLINCDKEELDIVTLSPGRGMFTEKLEQNNIHVDVVAYPKELDRTGEQLRNNSFLKKIKMSLGILKYIRKQLKYFKAKNIDLVYCNDIRSILTCGVAARLSGIPVLWYVRIDKNLGLFNQIAANIANQIAVIANNVKSIFKDKYIYKAKQKFNTIYTGIDLEQIDLKEEESSLREELGLSQDVNLVGTIASIQSRKGQKDLINSIAKLSKDNSIILKNTSFLVIGDTLNISDEEYLDEIKEIISKNKLEKNIFFLGWRSDVINIIKQLDLVVLPSYSEGLPRTVLESLACKCPVIATNVAGTGEIIEQRENGMLVKPGEIDELAHALVHMLSDKKRLKKMGEKGRITIERKFTMDKYVKDLQDLIMFTAK